jgi:hypothetical protein
LRGGEGSEGSNPDRNVRKRCMTAFIVRHSWGVFGVGIHIFLRIVNEVIISSTLGPIVVRAWEINIPASMPSSSSNKTRRALKMKKCGFPATEYDRKGVEKILIGCWREMM